MRFYTDGGEAWAKKNYSFTAKDVTPKAYKDALSKMGCSNSLDVTDVQTESTYDSINNFRARITIVTVKVKAGPAVRAIKFYENGGIPIGYLDDIRTYTYYLFPKEKDSNDKYWSYDDALYKKMRSKVGEQLWTGNMSKYEKLKAVADYINDTTHCPGETTSKEKNPEFWNDWSVDGIDLLYNMADSARLDNMMKLQGGITTCVAAYLIGDFAEDLGLEYIYDDKNDILLDKEGWYIGVGKYSSNPGNPYHYTFYYKNANGKVRGLDAQGLDGWPDEYRCEQHNCKPKILSLK